MAGIRQVHDDWEDMHPSVESPATQDQPQDLQYVAMGYYDTTYDDHSPSYRHHDDIVPDYARVAHDVPIQADVAPTAPVRADLTSMHTFI